MFASGILASTLIGYGHVYALLALILTDYFGTLYVLSVSYAIVVWQVTV